MASGGRPPHSAPSLPLHSSPSASLESLQTPDTSSLFLSSLGSQAGARTAADFSSLEDLLNYTGISSQPSSPSLETLAQHLEQKQASTFMAPPPAKRPHPDLSPSDLSSLPSNIRVSPLPVTSAAATSPSPSAVTSLFPTTVVTAVPTPPVTNTAMTMRLPQQTSEVRLPAVTRAPDLNHSLAPSSKGILTTSLSTTAAVPSVLGSATTAMTSPSPSVISSSGPSLLPSLPSNPAQRSLLVQLVQAYRQCSALGDTQGQARVKAQLNLLLQAQQKVNRASASAPLTTPTTPLTMHLTTPLTTPSTPLIASENTTLVNHVKPGSWLSPTTSLTPSPITTSPITPSHATPITPSLLKSFSRGAMSVSMATNLQTQTFDHSLTSLTSTPSLSSPLTSSLTSSLTSTPSLSIPSCLPSSLTSTPSTPSFSSLTSLTPINSTPSRAPGSSGPASALKAAALYNLRLRQLQLFLQSLPEEQRPHSIPELKALLQRSGGQLGPLAQPPAVSSSPPNTVHTVPSASTTVPSLLPASAMIAHRPPSTAVVTTPQPTVGQLMSGISATPLATPLATHPAAASATVSATVLRSLASGSFPLSPACLARFSDSGSGKKFSTVQPTTQPPSTTNETTNTTPLTTAPPQPTTSTIPITKALATPTATLTSPSLSGSNEPIKPGVPTPLPPGVNPETLAVLCRMPDSDLEKLKMPVVLMTAIRVWRGQQQNSGSQRGRKSVTGQSKGLPVIIPPSQASSLPPAMSVQPSSRLPVASLTGQLRVQSSQQQMRTEQPKTDSDRLTALNKVLQSSEEARIAYRFNMLRDKMTNQLMTPDSHTPFKSLHDVIARLLPYHMWSEAEPPPGAIEKADAVYESVAQVLISRSQGLMSNYQHLIYHDAQRDSEAVMGVCLERLFQESEKERRERESQQSQQAAQIAADLSLIAGALGEDHSHLSFDAEFALGDVMNSDPMLTFEPGIT